MMSGKKTTSPLPASIGPALRTAREAAGLTQAALAEKLGSKQPYVAAIERGEQGLSIEGLARWANALDVDPGQLLPTLAILRAQFGVDLAGLAAKEPCD